MLFTLLSRIMFILVHIWEVLSFFHEVSFSSKIPPSCQHLTGVLLCHALYATCNVCFPGSLVLTQMKCPMSFLQCYPLNLPPPVSCLEWIFNDHWREGTSQTWNVRYYKVKGLIFIYGLCNLSWCFVSYIRYLNYYCFFTFQRHADYHWPKYKIIISDCRAIYPIVEMKALPSSFLSDSL